MKRGFTLVELLVVIAILAILSSVILANVTNARERAQATRLLTDLRQMENALRLLAGEQGRDSWWLVSDLGCPVSSSCWVDIEDMMETYGLDEFLSSTPIPPIGNGSIYQYDSHGDNFSCGGSSPWYGVNIRVENFGAGDHFDIIDNMIDGGDGPNCGRVKYGGGSQSFYYGLGVNVDDFH